MDKQHYYFYESKFFMYCISKVYLTGFLEQKRRVLIQIRFSTLDEHTRQYGEINNICIKKFAKNPNFGGKSANQEIGVSQSQSQLGFSFL
jgi:hypothetical protein